MMNAVLNDKELEMVVGGDWGDRVKDNDPSEPMYKAGQEVEVYNTPLHWTTERMKIYSVLREKDRTYTYVLRRCDQGFNFYMTANNIQRN